MELPALCKQIYCIFVFLTNMYFEISEAAFGNELNFSTILHKFHNGKIISREIFINK